MTGAVAASGWPIGATAFAEDAYPNRPLQFMVPQAVGGSTDTVARAVAMKLSESIGQSIVVENRPGANGIVGSDLVAKSKPDGYTLLVGGTGTMAINQSLYSKLPYDAERDLAPVAMFGYTTDVLIVNPSVKANTIGELIADARANPGKYRYASAGAGSSPHLAAEMFRDMTGVQIMHIPYKGSTPGVVATVSGETEMMFTGIASSLGQIKAGRLKALSITGRKRTLALPDVPTANESGLPGFEAEFWIGLFAPARTPTPVIAKLNTYINRILNSREMADRFVLLGIEPQAVSPTQFGVTLKHDIDLWARTVKTAGIKGD
jgi:tripartite-type tricarboxylate transporter receptor subunit TctC